MAERGSLLANTYLLPQAQQAQAVQPQQPFADEIGAPAEGLQQVDGMTGDYFDKWAQLKGFARDVWENYNIDVRYPDPSVPESNRLHRIYLKSIADLKKQGELLKTSQKMYEASLQRGDIMNVDPRQQAFATMQPMNDVLRRELDPIVTEANNKLQQLYFGNAITEAKEYYEDIKGRLEGMAEANPDQREYWLRQIEALTPPTRSVREFAPKNPSVNQGRVNAAGNFMKKVANLMSGTADGYKISDKEVGPNGERIWVNKDLATGVNYGGNSVVEWQYIPSTKETFLKVRDSAGNIKKVPVSGADAISIAKTLVSENPRFAASGEYIDQYADQAGYFSDTGEVNPNVLTTPDAPDIYQKMEKEEAEIRSQEFKQKIKGLETELAELEPGFFSDDRKIYKTKDGRSVKVAARSGSSGDTVYEIENIKELVPGKKPEFYKRYKTLGRTATKNLLVNYGVLGDPNASGTVSEQPKATDNRADVL